MGQLEDLQNKGFGSHGGQTYVVEDRDIIPLKKNDEKIVAKAKEIKNKLQSLGLGRVLFENSGNIGKNYRRHDEIGTPICITIDFETLEEETVTIRDRDTMSQKRVSITDVEEVFKNLF